jgi:putative sigma-54 modulation protein
MQFTITGKHVEVTETLRQRVQEKVEKLPRYYDNINQVEVIVERKDGGKPSVEIIARGERGDMFVAKETGDEINACVDLAMHKIERQLHRKKEKQRDNKTGPGMKEVVGSTEPESQEDVV